MHGPLRDQLVEARRRSKLRQEDLAAAIGWKKHTHVSKIENGHASTQLEEADAWAKACGYEVVLVPLDREDPEDLQALARTVDDPFARAAVAAFCRLVRWPSRFWGHFLEDFKHESARAQRAADAERAERA